MKQQIVIPRMGESISEAVIGTIFAPTGSRVKVDQEILEIETDKVNQVLYAPSSGIVTLNVGSQESVKIGQVIGYIEEEEAVLSTPEEPQTPQEKKEVPSTPAKKDAAPLLRKGKDAFIEEIKMPSAKPADRSETRKKLPKIRQVIAQRLVEAQHEAAMLTTFNEVDLSQVIALRDKYKEAFEKKYQIKLGFMSFFVKATVSALKAFPEVNAYLSKDELVFRNYFDIGIAVSTDRGLVVPVLRGCDKLSFAEIERGIADFSHKAKTASLSVEELQGGGFTITNGGTFGSLLSTPILNPPQTAILGMHKITKRPVAVDDAVQIRPMMYLALTYDHRVLDGKEAVSFLVRIKELLEDPTRLALEI